MTPALYTRFVSGLLFPLHERIKGHTSVADLRLIEESQWWDRSRLRELQFQRLRSLLLHAASHVPYYRRLFADIGFDPGRVGDLSDLARLPLLTKAAIRAHTDDLRADDALGLARLHTGGSTGEPLIFHVGKERVSRDVAARWRATRWWGVDIGDPEIVVWGSPIELGAQDRLRALRDRALRTRLLPAFEMSEQRLADYVRIIRKMRPVMLFGYPSVLARIARYADLTGQRMDDLGVRVAFATAERLYDDQRDSIALAFGCRVANGYGGRDAGFVAHECPAGGMHITAEDIIVEILDDQGKPVRPGLSGEIVVTHLATRDFPFVRYRTGDMGVLDDGFCPCGRGLPLLKSIEGRVSDLVIAHDGTVMHGLALIYVVRDLPGIVQFKIVQESLRRTRVLVVPGAAFTSQTARAIEAGIKQRLGSEVEVAVEQVAEIACEPSGKFRYIVSRVDVQQPGAASVGIRPL